MCFLTTYLYKCGHSEEETYETCQTYTNAGFCCDEYTQQNVIMQDKCSPCRLAAAKRLVRTKYLYQCGHEEQKLERRQLYIDAGFCCDEYEQQNVVMQDKCSSCRLRVVRTNYLYQCGHEEQELERRQLCIDAGFCCDEHEAQNVVMPDVCVACKLAAKRAGVEKQSDEAEIAGCEERKGDERSLQWE